MNVFAWNPDPRTSAVALADQHVIKMTLESAQIASTALQMRGVVNHYLYRPTHVKHPCVLAAADDSAYLRWVIEHGIELAGEYFQRFGREHASYNRLDLVRRLAGPPPARSPKVWPLAMPDEFKCADPHEAYLAYLKAKYAGWARDNKAPRWKRRTDDNPFAP